MTVTVTEETIWQRAIHHSIALLGFVMMIGGTVVGNIAIVKMINAVNNMNEPVEREMFSTGEETDPVGGPASRAAAIKKYRETQPDAPLYKMLQLGWVLNGVGFLVMIFGVFR